MNPPFPVPSEGSAAVRRRITIDELRRELVEIQTIERTPKSAWRTDRELRRLQGLGVRYLDEITRATLSRWRASHGDEIRETTIKGYYSAVRAALTYAVGSGYLERNPADAMPMRFSSKKLPKKRHLDPDETMRLFRLLREESKLGWEQHRLYALAVTIFGVGLRTAEGQTLQVRDIDLDRGVIDLANRKRKTEASAVRVAMPDFVADALAIWLPETGSEWAFPHNFKSGPWISGTPGRKPLDKLQQAGRRAGVEHVTFAMGRHGWATFAQTVWGLTAKQIQVQLRHTTDKTQEHYCHGGADEMRSQIRSIAFPGFEPKEGVENGRKKAVVSA